MPHLFATRTPASALSALIARLCAENPQRGAGFAYSAIAEATSFEVDDLRAVLRGDVPLVGSDLARLGLGIAVARDASGLLPFSYGADAVLAAMPQDEEDGPIRYRMIMSTSDVDKAGDIVDQASWKLDDFRRNPVAPWAHSSWSLPVGRWHEVGVSGGSLTGLLEPFVPSSPTLHPIAAAVAELLAGGFVRAVSVGFIPEIVIPRGSLAEGDPLFGRRGYIYRNNNLIECSPCTIPMNGAAVRVEQAATAAPAAVEPVRLSWMAQAPSAETPPPPRGKIPWLERK